MATNLLVMLLGFPALLLVLGERRRRRRAVLHTRASLLSWRSQAPSPSGRASPSPSGRGSG
jgi:hypothetical protein